MRTNPQVDEDGKINEDDLEAEEEGDGTDKAKQRTKKQLKKKRCL
jgi:hypothetical protein